MKSDYGSFRDIYLMVNNDNSCDLEIRTTNENIIRLSVKDVEVSMTKDSFNVPLSSDSRWESTVETKLEITMKVIG